MFEQNEVLKVTCTPEAVFDHIARGFFEHHGLWDPAVVGMEKTSDGPVSEGTTGIERRRFGPWPIESEFVVTRFAPESAFGFRTTKGPMIEDVEFEITPTPAGCAVRQHLRLIPAALGLRVAEPLMRPMIARNVRVNTRRFRAALDALSSEPARTAAPGAG